MNMRELTYRYLHDELSEDEFAQLQRWIEADIANAEAFVRFASDDVGIAKTLQHNEYGELIFDFASNNDSANDADEAIDLQQLIELESQASPIPFTQVTLADQGSRPADKPLTLKEFKSAASYLIAHSVKTKAAAIAAIAAVFVLSLTLFLVLRTNAPAPQAPPIAHQNTPPKPAESAQPILRDRPVATLTAQHNATWAEGALAPGSKLHPNQRLNLTAGFAEITTHRGAVAIVQAPATIQLTDNDNAIRLHRGKLVGRVSPASRGFTVHTPGARVVDIGTKFGVAVDPFGGVDVRVFDGRVDVAVGQDEIGQPLVAGEIATVRAGKLERVAYSPVFDFLQDLSDHSVAPQLSGQVEYLLSPPPSIRNAEFEHPSSAFLFLEKRGAHVPAQMEMNDGPADLIERRDEQVVFSTREMTADVYTLHYDPDGTRAGFAKGQIVFNRRIIGVIYKNTQLMQSDALLASPGTAYETSTIRGIESGEESKVVIDGRTLRFDLTALKSDQIRILVESAKPGEDRPR